LSTGTLPAQALPAQALPLMWNVCRDPYEEKAGGAELATAPARARSHNLDDLLYLRGIDLVVTVRLR
jgi:hypothetical protein